MSKLDENPDMEDISTTDGVNIKSMAADKK